MALVSRQLRGKLLTQRELAERAGVSIDLIRKLEQGVRHTASVPSLQRIARALDVGLPELLGRPIPIPSGDPSTGVVAIRRALTPVDDLLEDEAEQIGDAPLSLTEAERTATYLWGCYWSGRYELLASLVPAALPQLRATYRTVQTTDRGRAACLLARGYQAAGDTLVHLGHHDTAWLAIRAAVAVAQHADNALVDAAMRMSVAWQLLVQGRYDESERVAVTAAQRIEPRDDTDPSQLSAFGLLTVTGATAAARSQRRDTARDLLAVAGEMATRIGHERNDHQTTFGPAKVAMLACDVHVVQDDWSAALAAAKNLSPDAPLPLASRARHLADLALIHLRLGQHERALTTLLTAEQMAPDWMRFQALPRQIVAELVERQRRISRPLHELALRLGALTG